MAKRIQLGYTSGCYGNGWLSVKHPDFKADETINNVGLHEISGALSKISKAVEDRFALNDNFNLTEKQFLKLKALLKK